MRPACSFLSRIHPAFHLLVILAVSFSLPHRLNAQAPPVPSTFQDLYTELDNYLINFNATLPAPNGTPYPTLMTAAIRAADGNTGPQMVSGETGMLLQLSALKAMGVQAIMVEIGFPMLYEPFLTSQSQTYSDYENYYSQLATTVRQLGMKLIIENDTLLVGKVGGNWDVAPFYATLNWEQYQQARAQTAVTIAQLMQPDYLVLLEEPNTEANDSGQTNASTVSGSVSLLSTILAAVQQAGVPNMQVGAGSGTAQTNPSALSFIQQYVTLPLNFIDFHIYPINNENLAIALQIASTAAAAGMPVAVSECWMWKVRDTELGILTSDQIQGRDPFSFWAPLDAYFIQTMQNMAKSTQMLFLDPFNSQYFFAYLPYNDSTENLTPSQISAEENAALQAANQTAQFTSTALSYYNSIVVPPDTTPPSAPTGLSGVSGNPTTAALSWNASTDNVGVAGYYVYRNGQSVATTANLYYQDQGLTESTTYTYTVQAFDLAGMVSAPSTPANVQTINVTPPTTPGNMTAQATSCTKVSLTWSPSTDNTGVVSYSVWMGLSPGSMTQVALAGGSATSYSNNALNQATTYYFGVQAQDKNHNISNMSAIVWATTPALPVPPSSVKATAASGTKVTVTWSASTGGLPIAHYLVYRGASPTSLTQVATTPNQTSYTDMTVTPATTYYYAIQAADSGKPPSQSGLSTPVPVTTYTAPSVPANLAAAPASCTKVTVTWSAAVTTGLPLGDYHVYKGASASTMSQLVVTPNLSFTDTTDACQTTYYYAVQSSDTGAPPDLSAISTSVVVTTYGDPSVPGSLTATPVSSSKISLTWSASSGGLSIANYKVYGGTSPSTLTQLAVTTKTSYTNTSLQPGTKYYYAVQATDTGNDSSALSGTVSATTLQLPTAPANVLAQGTSSSQIGVSWAPSSGSLPIAHYIVFRGTSPNGLSQVATTGNPSYKDKSLNPGTTYYYGIEADDSAGDVSPMSPAAPGSTQP